MENYQKIEKIGEGTLDPHHGLSLKTLSSLIHGESRGLTAMIEI